VEHVPVSEEPSPASLVVHGHTRAFVEVGEGPVLLLLHGIGSDSRTWDPVVGKLAAAGFRVIAPDFLGHGGSAKPRADYSLGGFANGMRDLLTILDIDTVAAVIGHSFGGGVAMQFAYQYPDRVDRVVLVNAGGLGRSINPILRALTLPGAGLALAAVSAPPVRRAGRAVAGFLHRTRLPGTVDLSEVAAVHDGLAEPEARAAFLHVLRAAVDWRGQVVTMIDRCYLAEGMPVLVFWGSRDTVITPEHSIVAAAAIPGATVEVFKGAGHFPHRQDPDRFVESVTQFVRETEPSHHDRDDWRRMLLARVGSHAESAAD
jgi:pimeloyl-ACP methyl ester carboxylesterase